MKSKKLKPCRKCGSNNVKIHDCGYTTFNPGSTKCLDCNHEVKVDICDWENPHKHLARVWDTDKPDDKEILDYLIKNYKIGTRLSISKTMRAKPKK